MMDRTKMDFFYLTNDFLEPHLDLKVPIKTLAQSGFPPILHRLRKRQSDGDE